MQSKAATKAVACGGGLGLAAKKLNKHTSQRYLAIYNHSDCSGQENNLARKEKYMLKAVLLLPVYNQPQSTTTTVEPTER